MPQVFSLVISPYGFWRMFCGFGLEYLWPSCGFSYSFLFYLVRTPFSIAVGAVGSSLAYIVH